MTPPHTIHPHESADANRTLCVPFALMQIMEVRECWSAQSWRPPGPWLIAHLHGHSSGRYTMKGASNVTLAQLIEAGVIEPGDQVLTVTVGGPGGTNTFIAGGHMCSLLARGHGAVHVSKRSHLTP